MTDQPVHLLSPCYFTVEGIPRVFQGLTYGDTWNGFDRVFTGRDTFHSMLDAIAKNGDDAESIRRDYSPDATGLYDLSGLCTYLEPEGASYITAIQSLHDKLIAAGYPGMDSDEERALADITQCFDVLDDWEARLGLETDAESQMLARFHSPNGECLNCQSPLIGPVLIPYCDTDCQADHYHTINL